MDLCHLLLLLLLLPLVSRCGCVFIGGSPFLFPFFSPVLFRFRFLFLFLLFELVLELGVNWDHLLHLERVLEHGVQNV